MTDPIAKTQADTPPPQLEDLTLLTTLRNRGSERVVFGRYRLIRELGAGGMAVVWLARDERLDLEVALKFLPGMVANDAEALQDLRREITRGLSLTHPAIVRVFDLQEDHQEGLAAISMEYVDGSTLADEKARQPDRCCDVTEPFTSWARTLCEVLAYVHEEARVVHRDLKPRNVMLSASGRLKVADFGIAATLGDSHSRVSRDRGSSGTPVYMSPQQALGRQPSPADDVYALGATLYELLTSKPPFFRGTMSVILNQVATEIPSSMAKRREELGITGRPAIPLLWEKTVAACLAKEPGDRPPSARAVGERLGLLSAEHQPRGRGPSTAGPRRRAAAIIVAIPVLALAGWWGWERMHPPVAGKNAHAGVAPWTGAAPGSTPTPIAATATPAAASPVAPPVSATPPPPAKPDPFRSAAEALRELDRLLPANAPEVPAHLELELQLALAATLPERPAVWAHFLREVEARAAADPGAQDAAGISSTTFAAVLALEELPIEDRRKLVPPLQRTFAQLAPSSQPGFAAGVLKALTPVDGSAAAALREQALESLLATAGGEQLPWFSAAALLEETRGPEFEAKRQKLLAKSSEITDPAKRLAYLEATPERFFLLTPADTRAHHEAIVEVASRAGLNSYLLTGLAKAAARDGEAAAARQLVALDKDKSRLDPKKLDDEAAQSIFLPVRRAVVNGDLAGGLRELRAVPAVTAWEEKNAEPLWKLAVDRQDLAAALEVVLRCRQPRWPFESLVRSLLDQGGPHIAEKFLAAARTPASGNTHWNAQARVAATWLAHGQAERARTLVAQIPAAAWATTQGEAMENWLPLLARLQMLELLEPRWKAVEDRIEQRLKTTDYQIFDFPALYLSAVWAGWHEKRARLDELYRAYPGRVDTYNIKQLADGLELASQPDLARTWRDRLPLKERAVYPWSGVRDLLLEGRSSDLATMLSRLTSEADRRTFWSQVGTSIVERWRRQKQPSRWVYPEPAPAPSVAAWVGSQGQRLTPAELLNRALEAGKSIVEPVIASGFRREAAGAAARANLNDAMEQILREISQKDASGVFDAACQEAAYEQMRNREQDDALKTLRRMKSPEARFGALTAQVSDSANTFSSTQAAAFLKEAEALVPSLKNYGFSWSTSSTANAAMHGYGLLASLSATRLNDNTLAAQRFQKARQAQQNIPAAEHFYACGRMAIFLAEAGSFDQARTQMKEAAHIKGKGTVVPAQIGSFWSGVARLQFRKKDRGGAEETLRMAERELRTASKGFDDPAQFMERALGSLKKPTEDTFKAWSAEFEKEDNGEPPPPLLEAQPKIALFLERAPGAAVALDQTTQKDLGYSFQREEFFKLFRSLIKFGTLEDAASAAERVRLGEPHAPRKESDLRWDRARALRMVGQRFNHDHRLDDVPAWVAQLPTPLDQAFALVGVVEGAPREGF